MDMTLNEKFQQLKTHKVYGQYYGLGLLVLLAFLFWAFFKILTPDNFGSWTGLYYYLQSSIIYSVGACGFYFIVTMGLFDFSIGANVSTEAVTFSEI